MLPLHWWTIVIGSFKKGALTLIEKSFQIFTSKREWGRTLFHDSTSFTKMHVNFEVYLITNEYSYYKDDCLS